MTKEEKQRLEESANAARETADQAHAAAAEAQGQDEALNRAADQAEEAAQKAQAEAEAAVVEEEPPTPSGEEEEPEDDTPNFEEEAARLEKTLPPAPPAPEKPQKTELDKATTALYHTAKRVKELGGDPAKVLGTPETPPAPPAPETPAPDERYVTKDDLAERDLQTEIRKLARSEAEYKVILWHAKNSIRPSGNPQADAENGYLLAYKGRVKRSFDEIRRAGGARPAPATPPGRRPAPAPSNAPKLTLIEQNILKRRGFTLKQDGSYESKHYRMHYDPKAKKWVQERK